MNWKDRIGTEHDEPFSIAELMKDTELKPCAKCKKCGGDTIPSKAIPQALCTADEGTISEASWTQEAPLIDVLKCKSCGHSFVPSDTSPKDGKPCVPEVCEPQPESEVKSCPLPNSDSQSDSTGSNADAGTFDPSSAATSEAATPTPRTDAVGSNGGYYRSKETGWYLPIHFARTLERELAAVTAERDGQENLIQALRERVKQNEDRIERSERITIDALQRTAEVEKERDGLRVLLQEQKDFESVRNGDLCIAIEQLAIPALKLAYGHGHYCDNTLEGKKCPGCEAGYALEKITGRKWSQEECEEGILLTPTERSAQ